MEIGLDSMQIRTGKPARTRGLLPGGTRRSDAMIAGIDYLILRWREAVLLEPNQNLPPAPS